MTEYIDKHDAYTLLKDLEAAYIYPPVKEAYATAARRIDQIKPADVQPVVYAHRTINVGRRSYCSNCGKLAIMENFCSKCGAKVEDGDVG